MGRIIEAAGYYGTLKGMLRKFDKQARGNAFCGTTGEEWLMWQQETRRMLWKLLGLDHMESCALNPEARRAYRPGKRYRQGKSNPPAIAGMRSI